MISAPTAPLCGFPAGIGNFESYSEVQIQGLPPIDDPYAAYFAEF
jgi:hypothetical protein